MSDNYDELVKDAHVYFDRLCTQVDKRPHCCHGHELVAAVEQLKQENFSLAANQCHASYGDERGNHRCQIEDKLKLLEQRAILGLQELENLCRYFTHNCNHLADFSIIHAMIHKTRRVFTGEDK